MRTLYSAPEAAEYLGISSTRVHQFLTDNRLRGFKVGSRWVISLEELRRFEAIARPPGNPNLLKPVDKAD